MMHWSFIGSAALSITLATGGANEGNPQSEQDGPGSIEVYDMVVGYSTFGSGYPLVMITGFSGTMDMWDPSFVSRLSDEYRVIVFDNRGMGETTPGDSAFTIERFADDTAGLMEALGIERAHVLAWSMGTEIALELVLRHPDRVDRLVLYGGDCQMNLCPPSPEVLAALYDTSGTPEDRGERMLMHLFPAEWLAANKESVISLFSGFSETSSPASIQKQAEAMDSWRGALDRLELIETPTLLVTGTEDVLTPPRNSIILHEGLPNSELLEIENAGHGLMYQYPERLSEAVLSFLSSQI
jgi:pimeloyl-ACP methyl ester carboxylesterase